MEHVSFDVDRGTTVRHSRRLGQRQEHAAALPDRSGDSRWQARIDIDGLGAPHRYEGVRRFGVLFQSGALFSSMTLAENLALPLTTWTSVRRCTSYSELVQAKLDLVGLGQFAEHLPGEISGRHEETRRNRASDDART